MAQREIVLVMGYPASGKTTHAQELVDRGYKRLNRDTEGGKVIDLVPKIITEGRVGTKSLVIDNLFASAESRKPFIAAAEKMGLPIRCIWVNTSIENAQLNACLRMIRKRGRLLMPGEKSKDPNIFPIAVLFKYRKAFEKPLVSEGFTSVSTTGFVRKWGPEYKNSAIIFDFDGTLRVSKGEQAWPEKVSDVKLMPGRKEKIFHLFHNEGRRLLGASNQSACASGLPIETAEACFEKTNKLLGQGWPGIRYLYCPHRAAPPTCWCRKPAPGMAAVLIEEYNLDPVKCTMVGDMTSDKTFAFRAGFSFVHADEFFK